MNKHTRSVSLIDGHIERMTDAEVTKALEQCQNVVMHDCKKCSYHKEYNAKCVVMLTRDALDLIKRQQAEIERYKSEHKDFVRKLGDLHSMTIMVMDRRNEIKSEAIKELSEKITEIFMRYAHLHTYAEGARKDFIETVDGKEIEMQSVWDVITLQMNGVAEYEEMCRLQKNIETIEKDRLLTELEKDFRLLVKEMTEVSENGK